jgi:carbonic anhydrase
VLGHASCGGVSAFANNAAPLTKRDLIGKWMSQIAPVAERVGPVCDDRQSWIRELEWGVVGYSLENLMTFPTVRDAVENGALSLHGAYFGVGTGLLFIRDPITGRFTPYSDAD